MVTQQRTARMSRQFAAIVVLTTAALGSIAVLAQGVGQLAPAQIDNALKAAYAKYRTLKEGKNADYIPALAKVNPNLFGIDGRHP